MAGRSFSVAVARESAAAAWRTLAAAICISLVLSTATAQGTGQFYPGQDQFRLAPRTALVVGVPKLQDSNGLIALSNPERDALAVAAALRNLGFDVISVNEDYRPEQLTRQNIKKELYAFADTLKRVGGVGLIYFAGHGFERSGRIYVAPYDAYVRFDRDIGEEMLSRTLFYDAFRYAGNQLNLLVIDACKDDPWVKQLDHFGDNAPAAESEDSKDSRQTPKSIIEATATVTADTTADGVDMSPYAVGFLRALEESDLSVGDFFRHVARTVDSINHGAPGTGTPNYTIVGGVDFVFNPSIVSFNREKATFDNLVQTRDQDLYWDIISTYAGGYFYSAAQEWRAAAPFKPKGPAAAPTRVVVSNVPGDIRQDAAPDSLVAAITKAGDQFAVIGDQLQVKGTLVTPVYLPALRKIGFVDSAILSTVSIAPPSNTYSMRFVPSATIGVEQLSTESAAQITSLVQGGFSALITRIDVVANASLDNQNAKVDPPLVVSRVGTVLSALVAAGFDRSKLVVYTVEAASGKENSVDIVANGNTSITTAETVRSGPRNSGPGKSFSAPYQLCSSSLPDNAEIIKDNFYLEGDRVCDRWATCRLVSRTNNRVCYEFTLQGHDEFPAFLNNAGIRQSEGVLLVTYQRK